MIKTFKKIPFGLTDNSVDYLRTDIIEFNPRWVIAHRNNISISVTDGLLEMSYDNSQTFPTSRPFSQANKLINGYIFRNGNIMLTSVDNKIYLTNYNLDFVEEKIVFDVDGVTPYPIHTPVNASFPGRYYYTHKYMASTDDTDIYIFGNYCNVSGGGAPVHLYYTTDFGLTFKIAYKFGQLWRDNGSAGGSLTTGTLLGDPNNTVATRHTHCVEYCVTNNRWYMFTGDENRPEAENGEIHWMEGEYFPGTDSWNWKRLEFGFNITQQSRLKSTEMFFHNDYLYYVTDATNVPPGNIENGIWRVYLDKINDINAHEKILNFPHYADVCSNLKFNKDSGNIVFTILRHNGSDTDTLGVATNFGHGNVGYKIFPGAGFIRLNSCNDAGYFRLDWNRFQTLKNRTFLIKVGYNLFDEYPNLQDYVG